MTTNRHLVHTPASAFADRGASGFDGMIETTSLRPGDDSRASLPAGWWIASAVVAGTFGWVGLLRLMFA